MKIAVCVKQVPEQAKRIDPSTKRLDRSRRGRAQPLRRQRGRGGAPDQGVERRGRGRPRLDGPGARDGRAAQGARDGRRPGASSSRRRRSPAPTSSPTSRVLAAALERESPDLVLFGQQASDSDGAVLWAAVADRLRRPLISQAAELEVADGKARAKRQTEYGYDVIEAPLPAVVAVSDAINEPRYPSLKGIMGAKKKPQEVLSLADLGVDGEVGEAGSRHRGARARRPAAARRVAPDRGRRQRRAGDRRLPRGEEADLMATLVFLEHHEGELQKDSLGVLSKAASLGDDGRGGRSSAPASSSSPSRRAATARARVYVADDARARGAAAAAARRRARAARPRRGLRHRPLRRVRARRRRRRRARGAARRRAELGPRRTWRVEDGKLVGKRPALQDSVYVDVGWTLRAAARALPLRLVRRRPRPAARPEVEKRRRRAPGLLDAGEDGRAGARGDERARRSRTPT